MYIKRDNVRIKGIILDLRDVIADAKKVVLFEYEIYNFWRLRDELVGNYYSDGTLERLAVHLGLL